jgi:abequosyltransferase
MTLMLSYAQNFEDVMLRRALGHIKEGFYVDVGAWDPDVETVTRHFYESGWRGINIEPAPTYRGLLETARPRDINLFVAVGKENGRGKFTIIDDSGMSTLVCSVAENSAIPQRLTQREIEVEVKTLDSIFDEHAPESVHFLKIDCEGAEADVINAFDLNRHRPWIILVEAIAPLSHEETHSTWEPHILSSAYNFVYFDGLNRFYVAAEHAELGHAFSVPPNVLDHFRSILFAPPPPPPPSRQLSIAIPVYNFANFIPETLNSIVAQEHGETVEIVVTDGASTDRTAEVMAEFCAKFANIIYNRLPKKGGIDRDMASAVEATHGRYVWLFSGDDIMHPGSLGAVLEAIKSEDEVYLCKHMECTGSMVPVCEWPVLEPDGPGVFELSDPVQRIAYFKRAVNSEASFSFCGGLIIRRSTWDRGRLDEKFVGSCWAHSARLFALMRQGLRVNYLGRALLSRRGENDSFSGNGLVERYRIQVDGFHDIVETYFGRNSPEAREVRRAIRSEFNPFVTLMLRHLCYFRPEVESKAVLDRIVARAYRDPSLKTLRVRLRYALMPKRTFRRKHQAQCAHFEHQATHRAEQARKRTETLSAN